MVIDPIFSECLINSERRILGVKLRPFCLWHLFLLQVLESPLILGKPVEIEDLRTAVAVCRTRHGESKLRKPSYLSTAYCLARKHNVREQFRSYVNDYLQIPEYSIVVPPGEGEPPRRGRAPEVLVVAADIIGWSHWPEKYVWELPLGLAYWYQSMSIRATGADLDFMTPKEREFQQQLKEYLSKKEQDKNGR